MKVEKYKWYPFESDGGSQTSVMYLGGSFEGLIRVSEYSNLNDGYTVAVALQKIPACAAHDIIESIQVGEDK